MDRHLLRILDELVAEAQTGYVRYRLAETAAAELRDATRAIEYRSLREREALTLGRLALIHPSGAQVLTQAEAMFRDGEAEAREQARKARHG